MKKIFILFFLFIMMLYQNVSAAELYKIRPVCFDMSSSLIFVPVYTQSPTSITNNIKLTKMNNANGVILEIDSASMDAQSNNLFFSSGNLKEFQIFQQSPTSVKILLYFKNNFNISNLKIGNINNNLIIITKPLQPYNMNYYINTYRENNSSARDYHEDLMITSGMIGNRLISVANNEYKPNVNEVHQAFSNSPNSSSLTAAVTSTSSTPQQNGTYKTYEVTNLTKNTALRSKYYLDDILIKDNLFIIKGVGAVGLQKPFLMENPTRIIYDMPNTILKYSLYNKEFSLSNGDNIRAGQFTSDTTRLVITSKNATKYIPVYSADSQSLMLTMPQNLMTSHLPSVKTNIVKTAFQKSDKCDNLIFEFDKPLCYSLKRTSEYLFIYFLNAEKYNDSNFQSVIRTTPYSEIYVNLMKNTGIRLTIPIKNRENINAYLSPDGRVFKLSSQKSKVAEMQEKNEELQKRKKKEGVITSLPKTTIAKTEGVVVIDAGHGGKDCGALSGNIYEKDINLDVALKLQKILQQKGYKVFMTRSTDDYLSLEERTTITGEINPDVFVSIHVNSCNASTPKGIETHYYNENSLELANSVHTKLTKKVNSTPNRGLLKSRFYVINHTTVPAILVEIGFISNPEERNQLTTPQRKQATAEGIAEGIIEYLNKQK